MGCSLLGSSSSQARIRACASDLKIGRSGGAALYIWRILLYSKRMVKTRDVGWRGGRLQQPLGLGVAVQSPATRWARTSMAVMGAWVAWVAAVPVIGVQVVVPARRYAPAHVAVK